jgi:hypothetical protein
MLGRRFRDRVCCLVQPRIRLIRSFDQRSHNYLGYTLKVRGRVGSEAREFLIGVGPDRARKYQFRRECGLW